MIPSLIEFYNQVNLIDLEEKFNARTYAEDGELLPSLFEQNFPDY
jgi:hypothetical protein